MEVESLPVGSCRICGAPLDPVQYGSVCANCFKDPQLLSKQPVGDWKGSDKRALDPDNPPWGIGVGIGNWGFSVGVSLIIPLIAAVIWLIPQVMKRRPTPLSAEELTALVSSPASILIQVISVIPVHILTLAFCWAVVTGMGKRPFLDSLGWRWTISPAISEAAPLVSKILIVLVLLSIALSVGSREVRDPATSAERWGFSWLFVGAAVSMAIAATVFLVLVSRLQRNPDSNAAVGIAKGTYVVGVLVVVLIISVVLERILPNAENTSFDLLIKSSRQARVWIAFLAVFTAPLVEEFTYRGVLYSSLRPRLGLKWSVVIVTLLFSLVHFLQYWGAWGGLAGLTLLSLALTGVRASTKSILPCVVIHTLNNVVGAIQILSMK